MQDFLLKCVIDTNTTNNLRGGQVVAIKIKTAINMN